jgi:hypothetical protein
MDNTATLRDLWIKTIDAGIHIRPKDIKSRILNLVVKVNYPVNIKKRTRKGRSAVVSSDDDNHADEEETYTTVSLFIIFEWYQIST